MLINESLKKSPFYTNLVDSLRAKNLDVSILTSSSKSEEDQTNLLNNLPHDFKIDLDDLNDLDKNIPPPSPFGSIHQSVLATILQKKEEALAKNKDSGDQENKQPISYITQDSLPVYDKPSNGLYRIQKKQQVFYVEYVNYKKNGQARVCDLNENTKITLFYIDDVIEGEVCIYGDNQNLETKLQYTNGKKNGPFTTYYENGLPMNSGFYIDNMQEGESAFFDMYGDICQKSFYKNGKKHGACITYFPKSYGGGIVQKEEYNHGVLVGKQEMFYANGELLQMTPYNQGKAQEYARSFNQKGNLLTPTAK